MCCRFYTEQSWDLPDVQTGEIFPSNVVPVLANSWTMTPKPFAMKWGYSAGGKLLINARSETASQKPLFSDGMQNRRCLVPAACYYEWERRDRQKIKYAIRPARGRVYLAGIYRLEEGRPVFTILTRDATPGIRFIHDRMPVILPEEAAGDWFNLRDPAEEVLKAAVQDVEYSTADPVQERLF